MSENNVIPLTPAYRNLTEAEMSWVEIHSGDDCVVDDAYLNTTTGVITCSDFVAERRWQLHAPLLWMEDAA